MSIVSFYSKCIAHYIQFNWNTPCDVREFPVIEILYMIEFYPDSRATFQFEFYRHNPINWITMPPLNLIFIGESWSMSFSRSVCDSIINMISSNYNYQFDPITLSS